MLPWVTSVVLLVFPIAIADFDYRYLLPVLPFACLAAAIESLASFMGAASVSYSGPMSFAYPEHG